jgi:tRNA 2-selenouridine synthase
MIIKTDIEEFLSLALQYPVLDARSPGEYDHAHIPGAYSLPLFTDEERKVVGTAYKQESREQAIKNGLDFFGVKMRKMVEDAEAITAAHHKTQPSNCVLVHCWRGGMRSAAVAWLLDLYGFKVYLLKGGYKQYRQWTLQQFEKPVSFRMIGGYTGSGKTLVLQYLQKRGKVTLDLEGLANHKGSAFGGLGKNGQPTQEQFENDLAQHIHALPTDAPVWVEDESRRIGDLNIPLQVWTNMRQSPIYFMDIAMEVRLDHIVEEYGKFKKEDLVTTIMRISKRLGGLGTRDAINHILEGNIKESFRILLAYYDKFYLQGLYNRANTDELITKVASHTVNPQTNGNLLLSAAAMNY